MNIKQKVNYMCERAVLWCIRGFLLRHSVVIAKEFARMDAEFNKFRSETVHVCTNHWENLQSLDKRLATLDAASMSFLIALDDKKYGSKVIGSATAGHVPHEIREQHKKQFRTKEGR